MPSVTYSCFNLGHGLYISGLEQARMLKLCMISQQKNINPVYEYSDAGVTL